MLILGSYGFSYTQNRLKIGEILENNFGKLLIIPLACGFEKETGEKEKNCAVLLGFKKENITVFDEEHPEETLNRNFDHIAVLGGNTFKLLYKTRKYRLDEFIKKQVENGADYLGFSAGAYLACPDIEYVKNFDDNEHITDDNFTALGLTDKYVLCHYDLRGPAEIKMCRQFIGNASELITITNEQLVVL